jgi:hypothetical protein
VKVSRDHKVTLEDEAERIMATGAAKIEAFTNSEGQTDQI